MNNYYVDKIFDRSNSIYLNKYILDKYLFQPIRITANSGRDDILNNFAEISSFFRRF